jgi:hypothetical protein
VSHTTTVEIPTETGSTVVVEVEVDELRDTYSVTFAGGLLDQSPEGLTAAVQMALLTIKAWR